MGEVDAVKRGNCPHVVGNGGLILLTTGASKILEVFFWWFTVTVCTGDVDGAGLTDTMLDGEFVYTGIASPEF